jgi:hypothetical protein
MGRELHDVEIFLSDQVTFHPETEFVAARGGEHERRHIDAEVRNLEAIGDHDIRKCGAADELFGIEIHEVDVEPVHTLGVREAEVQAHLLMLERKTESLEMREQADETLLLGHTVFDHLIADKEGLNAGFDDVRHETYFTGV